MIKKYFNKELVMIKEDNEAFENSTKCWICDNDKVDNNVKVRDHCHITVKYRYCNVIIKDTLKAFDNLKSSKKVYEVMFFDV